MKIGDMVSVIDDDFSGTIISIENSIVTLQTEDGFEMQYPKNELVVVNDLSWEIAKYMPNTSQLLSEKQSDKKPGKTKRKSERKNKKQPPMEVDLHIEKLVASTRGMDSYDILSYQLNAVRNRLQFAFQKKIQRVVFIHGVGEGKLKQELIFLLKKYDNLKFYDADYQKYGLGATEVYIFQNKK